MYPEEQGILGQVKKPGPLTRALVTSGIAQMPILPEQRIAFADGGSVATGGITRPETADELMARMTAKYGAPSAGPAQQPAPIVQQPAAPKQAPTQPASTGLGVMGILRGRKEAIDKAAGFANGGIPAGAPKRFKFEGEGGPREDKVPVKVAGQNINVSDGEQALIVPAKTAANAQAMKAIQDIIAGSNDGRQPDMGDNAGPNFRDGGMTDEEARKLTYQGVTGIATPQPTAQPAAQNAPTDPDTDGRRQYSANMGDAFANRGSSFAPPNGLDSNVLTPKITGITTQKPTDSTPPLELGISGIRSANQSIMAASPGNARTQAKANTNEADLPGRQGAYMAENNLRSFEDKGGGIVRQVGANGGRMFTNVGTASVTDPDKTVQVNSYSGVDDNESMAKANAIRQSIIDRQPLGGIGILGDGGVGAVNDERSARWRQDDLLAMARGGNRAAGEAIQANAHLGVEGLRSATAQRGQDINAGIAVRTQEMNGQLAQDRNQIVARGQDLTAATAADRLDSQERIAEQRTQDAGTRLTLPQRRSNFEIAAARKAVAGLTPEEIKLKTANYTATGRENKDYDPTLAKAVSLAGRRMYGEDTEFDQRQRQEQAQQPAGADGDVMTRFRADAGMEGNTMGKQTDMGVEVLDATGKLIGHYR